jgi:uncharacterized membrane protein
MNKKIDKELLNTMSRDPGNWRGLFYFNRKDFRIMVPKLYPVMGWTLNFASPYAYIILIAIIAIAVVSSYLIN